MYRSGLVELDAVVAVARLGVRLFNRTTRSVSLSEAGERFIATVGPALSDIHSAMEATTSQQGRPAGRLRLNSSVGAARQMLVPIVLPFQKRYPEVRVDIVTDAHLVDIVAKGFDAGIRTRDMVPSDMISVPFGEDLRFVVIGSPAYFKNNPEPRKPGDLMAHQCIRARWPSGSMYRWQFQKQGRELEIDVPGTLTLDEPSLMRDAALAGAGLAYMWEDQVREDIESGRLLSVLNSWMPSSPGFALYHPDRRNMPPALRAFIDMLKNPASTDTKGRHRSRAR
jgi:DNA-binding transcriptional LysR family regulator